MVVFTTYRNKIFLPVKILGKIYKTPDLGDQDFCMSFHTVRNKF